MVKNSPDNAGDTGSIPWSGRSPLEKEIANHSRYFCLGNPIDRGSWWVTVQEVAEELDMT